MWVIQYQYDKCCMEFKTKLKSWEKKHEVGQYKCDIEFTKTNNLKKHKKTANEGSNNQYVNALKYSQNRLPIKLGNISVTNVLRNSLKPIICNNTNRLPMRVVDINIKMWQGIHEN